MPLLNRLHHFPISFYSIVMGLLGLVIALEKSCELFQCPLTIPLLLIGLAAIVFTGISSIMLIKLVIYKEQVIKDFSHPIKISFFPTFSISLLLFSVALLPISIAIARIFWLCGTSAHFAFTFLVISQWIKKEHYRIEHLSPAWFIPVVGNLLIPVAGVNFANPEVLWFFFSIGIIFWPILMTTVIYRLIFHTPLAEKLLPTLFILIAPPAIGAISYFKLTHQLDSFMRILYYFSLFTALLLIANIRLFVTKKFYLSQWAFTFPIAAFSAASALMYHVTKNISFAYIHIAFLTLAALVIVLLTVRTIRSIYANEICQED